jgi:hypothetical protein
VKYRESVRGFIVEEIHGNPFTNLPYNLWQ